MIYSNFKFNDFFLNKKYFKPLFLINNIRFSYILKRVDFFNKSVLDVGCGIGLLSEKLSLHGGFVTGVDKSYNLIKIALARAKNKKINVKYLCFDFLSANDLTFKFDFIICTEVIEHLPDLIKFFDFLNKVSKKDTIIFISSLNKSLLSYFKIIFLGEFFSNSLIKNTHNYYKFIDIYELNLNFSRNCFIINDIKYLNYDVIFNYAYLGINFDINYFIEIVRIK